jgi:phosphatidylglycerophosphatase A
VSAGVPGTRVRTRVPRPTGGLGEQVAFWLALWFGCGLVPIAPGTAGTLGALPLYFLLRLGGAPVVAAGAVALTAIGIWAAGRVARQLGTHDPQVVCIDEVAGVMVALVVAPHTWAGVATAVVLFRLTDQVKPWPARMLERRCPGGWGIVLDDIAAGVWAAFGVLIGRRLGWL